MSGRRIEAGAIILAAGLSTRFGGFPKALATFGGQTLLRKAVECFQRCGLKHIAVVTGHRREEVGAAAADLGVSSVFNPGYHSGMFSSIQTGVLALAGVESFFVLPVDAALIQAQTVLALLTAWRTGPSPSSTVLIPAFNGQPGHPPLIDIALRDSILNWAGVGGLRGWLASLMPEAAARTFQAGGRPEADSGPVTFLTREDEGILCDLDTRAELAAASLPPGRTRPTPPEAWQFLHQANLSPAKIRHSRLVAGGALRLSLALDAAGLEADSEAALLAGLLHDVGQTRPHDQAGRLLCGELGWPELALIVGAHTDPPPPVLAVTGLAGESGAGSDAYEDIPGPLARAALAVYLADKYWSDDQPVRLEERFQASRNFISRKPGPQVEALAAVSRREAVALGVAEWFRQATGRHPEATARQPAGHHLEEAVARLAGAGQVT